MGCPGGKICLEDHVKPWLKGPEDKESGGYRAFSPCHHDSSRSLSVSVGATGRVIWQCFACRKTHGKDEEQRRTREALIKAGVPAGCLRRPAADAAAFEETVAALVFGKEPHSHRVLRLAAMLRGFGDDLPRGAELRDLADECGISLTVAYEARAAPR